jgi:rubrerythrin
MSQRATQLREQYEHVAGGEFGSRVTKVARCRECGSVVRGHDVRLRSHRRMCESNGTAFRDGRCPSCGDEYESYLDHIEECDVLGGK